MKHGKFRVVAAPAGESSGRIGLQAISSPRKEEGCIHFQDERASAQGRRPRQTCKSLEVAGAKISGERVLRDQGDWPRYWGCVCLLDLIRGVMFAAVGDELRRELAAATPGWRGWWPGLRGRRGREEKVGGRRWPGRRETSWVTTTPRLNINSDD